MIMHCVMIRPRGLLFFLSVLLLGPTSNADERPIEVIAARIGDLFQSVMGGNPLKRPVFGKSHGCVQGEFKVEPKLPAKFKVGVFTGTSYPAWVRFANDGGPGSDKVPAARGMSIKLVGVPGLKVLDGEKEAVTQDFVMQNHPTFFVDTAADFLDFTEASFSSDPSVQKKFDAAHPETSRILAEMDRNQLADPLDGEYWTPTPYRLGTRAMKYRVKPCTEAPDPSTKPMEGPNYLRQNLINHLQEKDACFSFWVQVQKDEEATPIDRATVLWKSPFRKVATLVIPKGQNVDSDSRKKLCERMSFTGWHSLPEHAPLGSINEARGIIYKRIADHRSQVNGVSHEEPKQILATE